MNPTELVFSFNSILKKQASNYAWLGSYEDAYQSAVLGLLTWGRTQENIVCDSKSRAYVWTSCKSWIKRELIHQYGPITTQHRRIGELHGVISSTAPDQLEHEEAERLDVLPLLLVLTELQRDALLDKLGVVTSLQAPTSKYNNRLHAIRRLRKEVA